MPYSPAQSSIALFGTGTADQIYFTGTGVTASIDTTGVLTVNIPGGGGGAGALILSGVGVSPATATLIYITGAGHTLTIANSTATINAPLYATASAVAVQVTGTSVLTASTTLNFINKAGFMTASVVGNTTNLTMSFPTTQTDMDAGGNLLLTSLPSGTASPTAPAAGHITLFARQKAGRNLPNFVGPSGMDTPLQPFLGLNAIRRFTPFPNATTITADGLTLVSSGTATARAISLTSFSNQIKRVAWVTTAASGGGTGYSVATGLCFMGTGSNGVIGGTGQGGFYHVVRFFPGQTAAANLHSCFVGLVTGTGASYIGNGQNINPSQVNNQIGVGYDRTDTQWQFLNGAGAGSTKTSTNIPIPSASLTASANNAVYELRMFAAPNSNTVNMSFEKLNPQENPALAEYSTNTNLPTGSLLTICGRMNQMTTTVVSLEVATLYLETDT